VQEREGSAEEGGPLVYMAATKLDALKDATRQQSGEEQPSYIDFEVGSK
jgi:hypothetical protein